MISASVGASMGDVNASAFFNREGQTRPRVCAMGISQSGVSAASSRTPSLLLSTRRGLSLLSKTAASSANPMYSGSRARTRSYLERTLSSGTSCPVPNPVSDAFDACLRTSGTDEQQGDRVSSLPGL